MFRWVTLRLILNKIGCWYVDRMCVACVGIGLAAPVDTLMNVWAQPYAGNFLTSWRLLDCQKITDQWKGFHVCVFCALKVLCLTSDVKHGRRRNIVVSCCRSLRNFIMSPHSLSALWSNRTKTSHQILEMPDRLPSRRSFLKCLLLSRWVLITRSVDGNFLALYVIGNLIPNNTVFYCVSNVLHSLIWHININHFSVFISLTLNSTNFLN